MQEDSLKVKQSGIENRSVPHICSAQYAMNFQPPYSAIAASLPHPLTLPASATILASSCECERLFNDFGDSFEPERRATDSRLLSPLQRIQSWTRAGFKNPFNTSSEGGPHDHNLMAMPSQPVRFLVLSKRHLRGRKSCRVDIVRQGRSFRSLELAFRSPHT